MQCPKCHSERLRATKIEQGLSAMGCSQCGGAFVALLYYRDWLERTPVVEINASVEQHVKIESNSSLQEIIDSQTALSCPKCNRIMSKYKISGESDNKLDLCVSCDEAWLDGGEWELLKILELSRNMPLVFTEQWQRKLRKQATQEVREERLLRVVSQEDLNEAKKIKRWLMKHPNKEQIAFFINQE